MPILFVLDEHLRGLLWKHVLRHNARAINPIDAIRVGDLDELPLGILDPELLQWCEKENRILVSLDRRTLPDHLRAHLISGGHSPGIFICRDRPASEIIAYLEAATYASEPAEWRDQISFIP